MALEKVDSGRSRSEVLLINFVTPGFFVSRIYSANGFVGVFPRERNSVSEIRRIDFNPDSTRGNFGSIYVSVLVLMMITVLEAFLVTVAASVSTVRGA